MGLLRNIVGSLDARNAIDGMLDPLVVANGTKVDQSYRHESQNWDFKRELDLQDNRHVAKLAKHVLAFHNASGGAIFVGVDEASWNIVGVPRTSICEPYQLRQRLVRFIGEQVDLFASPVGLPHLEARSRCVWVILVPGTSGSKAWARKGFSNVLVKGGYYMRRADQSILVQDPVYQQAFFHNATFTPSTAYSFDVDIPYYRLLARHHEMLYGRDDDLDRLRTKALGRYPIVSVEGPGGIGKTSLAVELTHRMYEEGNMDYILSTSAKRRVWDGRDATRVPAFGTLHELLRDLGSCVGIDTGTDVATMSRQIRDQIAGSRGLILIDNLEDIPGNDVIRFLRDEMSEWDGVNIVVTSRIERLGEPFPLGELDSKSSEQLFVAEVRKLGLRYDPGQDKEHVTKISEFSAGNPLVLKWAASLANESSLSEVARRLRSNRKTADELLGFCFHSMLEGLPPEISNVALLVYYMGDAWSEPLVAFALETSISTVQSSVETLVSRSILTTSQPGAGSLLPLTRRFLEKEWRGSPELRRKVEDRLGEVHITASPDRQIRSWLRITRRLLSQGNVPQAEASIACALSLMNQEGHSDASVFSCASEVAAAADKPEIELRFLRDALNAASRKDRAAPSARIRLARRMAERGRSEDVQAAMELLVDGLAAADAGTQSASQLANAIVDLVKEQHAYALALDTISDVMELGYDALTLAEAMWHLIRDGRYSRANRIIGSAFRNLVLHGQGDAEDWPYTFSRKQMEGALT